ncbi:MAG: hypothetical protein IPL27_01130 [Lewinellaceae bacterium]|nr:hypothetical protein [Lewinellaceae bacterium]
MFATKNSQVFAGIAAAIAVAIIVSIGYHLSPTGSSIETFFFALGGKLPNGFIQVIAFAGFLQHFSACRRFPGASPTKKPLTAPNCCRNPNNMCCIQKT